MIALLTIPIQHFMTKNSRGNSTLTVSRHALFSGRTKTRHIRGESIAQVLRGGQLCYHLYLCERIVSHWHPKYRHGHLFNGRK